MKRLFDKVGIIGVGLIGGSIARAIKEKKLANRIIGVSRHKESIAFAKRQGLIDEGSIDIRIIKDVDFLVLAAPVETITSLAEPLSKILRKDCLVIDVGSTKEKIVSVFEKSFIDFVGCHPLAGSEKRGAMNSRGDIFKNTLCIITPTRRTQLNSLKKARVFWKKMGCRLKEETPAAHDEIVAFTSHLPHVVAFSLIQAVPEDFLKLSATGLKDTTRIAASDPHLWVDIFLNNPNTLKSIDNFAKILTRIKTAIREKNKKELSRLLETAKKKRERLVS